MTYNNSEEKYWINQQLIFYKDNVYNTNNSIDLTISSNTSDYKNFSIPTLNFSIYGNVKHQYNMTYYDCYDLYNSLKIIYNNLEEIYLKDEHELNKSNYNKNLKILFKKSKTNEKAIVIQISNNLTDFSYIILPLYIFNSFYNLIESYLNNYTKILFDLCNRNLLSSILEELKLNNIELRSLSNLKTLDSNLDEYDNNHINNKFEEFMENNINDIRINELDEEVKVKASSNNYTSYLFEKVLNNNIKVIEDIFTSIIVTENPFATLLKIIDMNMEMNNYEDNLIEKYIPSIDMNEYKSFLFQSISFFKYNMINYLENKVSFPTSLNIMKYKIENININEDNKNLAYDFLIILIYVKLLNKKLLTKENDDTKNKSILYNSIRCFCDIIIFSFLEDCNVDMVSSMLMDRYNHCKDNGFFKEFSDILFAYNINDINDTEIKESIKLILSKNKEVNSYISDYHMFKYKNNEYKINYENNFSKEQIIKVVSILEAFKNLKYDIYDNDVIARIFSNEIENKETIDMYRSSKEYSNKETYILKFIRNNLKDISPAYRNRFLDIISKCNEKIIFKNINLEILDENILKAMYVWNDNIENIDSINYEEFIEKIENLNIERNLLICKFNEEGITENSSWDSINFLEN